MEQIRKYLRIFCANTNLHGLKYIVDPSRSIVEKCFWFISALTSFILTTILITKFLLESQKNPIVIYKDTNDVIVEDINFPAITVCPGLIYKTPSKVHVDYEEIKLELLNHTIEINQLNTTTLKLLQVASLVARDQFFSRQYDSLSISTNDFLDVFKEFNQTFVPMFSYPFQRIKILRPLKNEPVTNFYGGYDSKYAIFVNFVLTQYGLCFTFNMPNTSDIFNLDKIDEKFILSDRIELLAKASDFLTIVQLQEAPYLLKGTKGEMKLTMYQKALNPICYFEKRCLEPYENFKYTVPSTEKFGYRVILHDPFDVISEVQHFTWSVDKGLILSITPQIMYTDDTLVSENLEFRNCYLPHERHLTFFKVYSKINCEHECWVKMTLDSCGCVQFFMPRNQRTRICGISDESCFRKVEDEFQVDKSTCRCYEPCNYIKYVIKLQNLEQMGEIIYYGTRLVAAFSDDKVYATRRRKNHTTLDFFSFFGGLLGLNSSIHGLNQIGNRGKSRIERATWLILFMLSMTIACFMMRDVYKNLSQLKIVNKFSDTAIDLKEIPFSALTVLPRMWLTFITYNLANGTNFSYYEYESYFKDLQSTVVYSIIRDRNSDDVFRFKSISDFCGMLKITAQINAPPFKLYDASWNKVQHLPFTELLSIVSYGFTFNLMEFSNLFKSEAHENLYLNQFVAIHPSNELPIQADFVPIRNNTLYDVWLIPEITITDKDLKNADIGIRKCYFEGERKLKYFKIYTQKNCELECLSYIVEDECTCAHYNHLRGPNTDICYNYSSKFCTDSFKSVNLKSYDHFYDTHGVCNCLPLCDSIFTEQF